MKKKTISIIFLCLLIMFISVKLYPNQNNITKNKIYTISSEDYDKELTVNINTQAIDLNKKTIKMNEIIHEKYDTKIALKEIQVINNSVWIHITCDTKWSFFGGTSLTFNKVSDESGSRKYSGLTPIYQTTDSEGNKILNNGIGCSNDDIFSVEVDKEVFQNTQGIVLKVKGLYIMDYDLKL